MRILLVNDTKKKIGGAETYICNLKKILEEKGCKAEVFGSDRYQEGNFRLLTTFFSLGFYFQFKEKLKEFSPDIVHFHNIWGEISASVLIAAKRMGFKTIMTLHDFYLVCPKRWFIFEDGKPCVYGFSSKCIFSDCQTAQKNFLKNFLKIFKAAIHRKIAKKYIDFFISPSLCLSNWLQKNLQIEKNKIKVIPNFILPESQFIDSPSNKISRRASNGYSIQDHYSNLSFRDQKTILYVGRLSKEKGIDVLIKAFKLVLKKIPSAKLIIIGKGEDEKRLKNLSSSLSISSNLAFKGYLFPEQIKNYYLNSQVLIVPSLCAENMPLSVLEAYFFSLPVIASDSFGLKELVQDKGTGFLFKRGSPEDLSKKIIAFLSDASLQQDMRENIVKKINKFSSEVHFSELMKIYKMFIASCRRA